MDSGAATVPPPEHLEIARDESAILDAWRILALDSMPSDHPEKLQASETLEKSTYKLEPLHNQDGTPVLTQESENLAEKRLTHVLCFKRPSIAETSDPSPAIVSHYEFSRRFKETCQGLLDGLDWTNIFVAGGSVLACLLPEAQHEHTHADVDIFLTVRSEEEANRVFQHIHSVISTNAARLAPEERYKSVTLKATARTVSIVTVWKVFQVITSLYCSPLEVLAGFDLDCVCVGTLDGVNAVATKRGKISLSKRYNLWMLSFRRGLAYEGRYQKRLLKHSKKGFGVLVSGVDWSKLPNLSGVSSKELEGVALLAYFDRMTLSRPSSNERRYDKHVFASGIEECIHGGDAWCHYCHKKLPHHEADEKERLSLANPIKWERQNLTRQDFEVHDGVAKQIRSFAFMRDVDSDFEDGVYSQKQNDKDSSDTSIGTETTSKESLDKPKSEIEIESKQENQNSGFSASNEGEPDSNAFENARNLLSDSPGVEIPQCYCGIPCKMRSCTKTGKNFRRRFFSCMNSQSADSCQFFLWEGSTATYDQLKAQRKKDNPHVDRLTEALAEINLLDTSKHLLAIASCYKSGRISDRQRTILKDAILSQHASTDVEETLIPIFADYANHFDLDLLAGQLADYCNSTSSNSNNTKISI